MSLEVDVKSAKGYIPNAPQKHYESASGFAPALWYGDDAVAATAVWNGVPVGSIYVYKASESAAPVTYQKVAAGDAVTDWAILQPSHGASVQIKKIPITTLTDAEIDTGWDLPAKAIVLNVWVDVTTAEATAIDKTMDVGLLSSETGGDADGFLDGVSTAATGIKTGSMTFTDGSSQNYVSASTWGVLLYEGLLGADGAGTAGTVYPSPHIAGSVTAKSVSYTLGDAATELVANIYIHYALLGQ